MELFVTQEAKVVLYVCLRMSQNHSNGFLVLLPLRHILEQFDNQAMVSWTYCDLIDKFIVICILLPIAKFNRINLVAVG